MLSRLIKDLNRKDDNLVNEYMIVVRMLTSENKYDVRLIQNDIIVYLEAVTLPIDTCVLLTNDNCRAVSCFPVWTGMVEDRALLVWLLQHHNICDGLQLAWTV